MIASAVTSTSSECHVHRVINQGTIQFGSWLDNFRSDMQGNFFYSPSPPTIYSTICLQPLMIISISYSNLVYKVRDWLMEPPGLGVIKRILISINLRLQFISCQNNNSGNLLLISGTYKSVIYNNKQKLQVLIKVNLTLWRYLIELSASLYWLVIVCIRAYNEYAN